ncbi:enoyl-CoA hydratase [Ferrithrix thermotolerans DSM 19514]|uniref:Enoyl-CoA hydratase n=1 Tax=Ferrithrix thermotolerans DSM 19514 TaxID=1121881 RepID=A0A1M4VV34_9ACTN|nr:enoyl-CoA hydratase-related protein [Ferrithrix thermotolerans]SHE72632.1 enoyl-CoA hydratase [Ferrithrix thermotolerans DSM 19514]
MSAVAVEHVGNIAVVRLSRSHKLNAMGKEYFDEMPKVLKELDSNDHIRAVVITADGQHFSSGLDLSEMSTLSGNHQDGKTNLHSHIKSLQSTTELLANLRHPTIAAVSGYCIGGGIDLISACSIRFCSADSVFSIRETKIAIVADLGTLQLLPSIIPKGLLYELALTGRDFDATEALRINLVNEVLPDKELCERRALNLAAEIAENSLAAVRGTKKILDGIYNEDLAKNLEYVALWNTAFLNREDLREVARAFAEKRPPRFSEP